MNNFFRLLLTLALVTPALAQRNGIGQQGARLRFDLWLGDADGGGGAISAVHGGRVLNSHGLYPRRATRG